ELDLTQGNLFLPVDPNTPIAIDTSTALPTSASVDIVVMDPNAPGVPSPSTAAGDVFGPVHRSGFVGDGATRYSFGNPDVSLAFTGTPPAGVLLDAYVGLSICCAAVSRIYTVYPAAGSGYTATLRLRYLQS